MFYVNGEYVFKILNRFIIFLGTVLKFYTMLNFEKICTPLMHKCFSYVSCTHCMNLSCDGVAVSFVGMFYLAPMHCNMSAVLL
jgi:hypothetical protein